MIHYSNSFLGVIESPADGTRPHRTTWGTAFSLGASNSMGSYVQLVDGSTAWSGMSDGCHIALDVNTVAVAAQAHNAMVTLGIDLAGGTSYTDWIQYLLVSSAGIMTLGTVSYGFPIRVPKGASIAIKGQDSHATPIASSYARLRIFCNPTHPELLRVGTFVEGFGLDTANSAGTAITGGTASDGSWTQLGSALTRNIFAWEFGVGCTNTSAGGNAHVVDLAVGDASNKRRVLANGEVHQATSETIDKRASLTYANGMVGDIVYARSQGSAAFTGGSVAAYGVG